MIEEQDVLRVKNIFVENNNKIIFDYEYSGIWKKILSEQCFFVEYDFDVREIPNSIKIIPLLSNILPIAWYFGAKIEVNEIDKSFWNCLKDIFDGYQQMYPNISFKFDIIAQQVIENRNSPKETNKATLFSGGVDSFSTLLGHIEEKPNLITILGADISLNDIDGQENVKKYVRKIANKYCFKSFFIKSNLKSFINNIELDKYLSTHLDDDWWHAFQHGLGIIGLNAVLAYKEKLQIIYIASSHSYKEKNVQCASDPRIDNKIKFLNCSVIHDQYNYTRQDKINLIVNKSREYNEKPFLRVCWKTNGGINCSICEKCARTIYGIIAAKDNPNLYGFVFNRKTNKKIIRYIKYKFDISNSKIMFWNEIQNKFRENTTLCNDKMYRWINNIEFDKIQANKIRKIRKKIGALLHKLGRKYKSGKI